MPAAHLRLSVDGQDLIIVVETEPHLLALVSSKSHSGDWHIIREDSTTLTCTCEGFLYRGLCRHIDTVLDTLYPMSKRNIK